MRNCEYLFPTPIGIVELLSAEECEKYSKLILNLINRPLNKFECYCTDDNLHLLSEFKNLVNSIDDEVNIFSDDILGLKKESLYLTGMWSNVRKPGSQHNAHNHPNSFLSGVLYLNITKNLNDNGSIVFHDPRIRNTVLYGDFSIETSMSNLSYMCQPKNGMLLLFPSWLEHSTTNFISLNDNDLRISLSFNYMIQKCSTKTMRLKN